MRKGRFFGAVLVMALWAAGMYAWGRHDGVVKGRMELPNVQIQWKNEEAPKTAEAKEIDYVSISNQACGLPVEQQTTKKEY